MSKATSPAKVTKAIFGSTGVVAGSVLAAVGGWWVYSRLGINHDAELPPALDAQRTNFITKAAGRLNYYSDQRASGTPLVLIHSVNAAASAFEVKPLFDMYRNTRPVYALELPGYGFSDRADRNYTPELFAGAIGEFLEQVGKPADVVALSLSSEFVARAALTAPQLFRSLTLISPTGMNSKREARASDKAGKEGGNETFYAVSSNPLWARAFYDLIATPASIRYFLQKSFVGPVPEDLARYGYLTSHQPGAEYVPLRFIAGKLFDRHIRENVYERLNVPTLVPFDEDGFVSFEKLPELTAANPKVKAVRLEPSKGLPHFEMPSRTAQVLDGFWLEVDTPAKLYN